MAKKKTKKKKATRKKRDPNKDRLRRTGNATYAHDWDAVGEKRIRRWHGDRSRWPEKRPVKISITTWRGTNPDAVHYRVEVREHENQWWNGEDNSWVSLSCDTSSAGLHLEATTFDEQAARAIAKRFCEIVFSEETHKILWPEEYDDEDDEDGEGAWQ